MSVAGIGVPDRSKRNADEVDEGPSAPSDPSIHANAGSFEGWSGKKRTSCLHILQLALYQLEYLAIGISAYANAIYCLLLFTCIEL